MPLSAQKQRERRAAKLTQSDAVPPLPPPLRPKPQRRSVGHGKAYATVAEFDADIIRWQDEKRKRAQLVKLREKALDKQRDRSDRKRDTHAHETDNQRRVRARKNDREFERHAVKRQAAQLRRVQVDLSNEFTVAVRDCIVSATSDEAYAEARNRLVRLLWLQRWAVSVEGWPCGCKEWDAEFDAVAAEAPTFTATHRRPPFDRWQVESLMGLDTSTGRGNTSGYEDWDAYDPDKEASDWDWALEDNPAHAGTRAAAITGRDIVVHVSRTV